MDRNTHLSRVGFSLIELLVTIGVVGILLGILLPVLASARRPAQEIKSLANLRSIGQTLEIYLNTSQDTYPSMEPGVPYPVGIGANTLLTIGDDLGRWSTSLHWYAVVRDVAPLEEHGATWLSPGVDAQARLWDGSNFLPSYRLSMSFLARPGVWIADTNPTPDMIRPVRRSMVAYPGLKALMWDVERAYLRRDAQGAIDPKFKTPVLFADGHASARHISEATPGFPNPLNDNDSRVLHNTPGGVTGTDF
jgi:prepilin-type N-terminal cleavage/methylation domain-containing protein/prepilin-type processing-associated H-X9-DG protein